VTFAGYFILSLYSAGTPGRRHPAALVLAAFLAYSALGAEGSAPALFVAVRAQLSVDIRGQGEPVTDGQGPGYRRASNGVQVPRHHRSHRPAETDFVAGNTSAAEPVDRRLACRRYPDYLPARKKIAIRIEGRALQKRLSRLPDELLDQSVGPL
jgi:hypothetical protein